MTSSNKSKEVNLDIAHDTRSNANLFPKKSIDFFLDRFGRHNCVAKLYKKEQLSSPILKETMLIECQTIEEIQDDIYFVFIGNVISLLKKNIFRSSFFKFLFSRY